MGPRESMSFCWLLDSSSDSEQRETVGVTIWHSTHAQAQRAGSPMNAFTRHETGSISAQHRVLLLLFIIKQHTRNNVVVIIIVSSCCLLLGKHFQLHVCVTETNHPIEKLERVVWTVGVPGTDKNVQ